MPIKPSTLSIACIDEEEPSRLDYGKHKFSAQFTEKEVEDVKTVLQLMPLFISPFRAFVANNLIRTTEYFQNFDNSTKL